MAFLLTNFAPMGNPSKRLSDESGTLKGAPTLWSYATNDVIATLIAAGYFNEVAGMVNVGDLIYCVIDFDGTLALSFLPVLSNASGVVDVGDGLVVPVTDTT